MPTYEYECDACGHKLELFQSIKDEPEKKCPECKKKKLRRLLGTGAGIIFKGSGFYITDYRSDNYKQRAAADKPSESTSSSSDTKSDAKSGSSGSSSSGSGSASSPESSASTKDSGSSSGKSSAGKSSAGKSKSK